MANLGLQMIYQFILALPGLLRDKLLLHIIFLIRLPLDVWNILVAWQLLHQKVG
jgi:hypothetical protein